MKRFLSFVLILAFVISAGISGCGTNKGVDSSKQQSSAGTGKNSDSESKPAVKAKVRMAYWNKEDTVKTLLELIKNKLPDVNLEYQFIDNKQFGNIISTQLAAGEGPDILCESPASALKHSKLGYVEDLSARYAEKYLDGGKAVYTDNEGKLIALPQISWFEGIFYNKDIFDKYGLKPPKTFEEELALHEALKKAGIKPQAMGAKSTEPLVKSSLGFIMNDYLFTDAGKGFDQAFAQGKKTMEGNLNSSLEKWSELIKRGYLTSEMLGIDYEQALDEFASGKAAMWESGPWAVEAIKKKNPNMKFDMFPFYGNKQSVGWLIGGPGVGLAVNKDSKNKDAVYKILDLITTEEGQRAFWNDNKGGSSFVKGVTLDIPDEFSGCKEALSAGNVYCPWNNWGELAVLFETYGKGLQEFIAGKNTIPDVLKSVDNKAQELLQK